MDAQGLLSVPLPTLLGVISALVLGAALIALLARRNSSSSSGTGGISRRGTSKTADATVNVTADSSKQRCTILFGTQTGTAERFAKSLRSQLESKYGSSTAFEVLDVENYDPERLPREKLVMFLMATYGDGEPTDSATQFYAWLQAAVTAEQPELLKVGHWLGQVAAMQLLLPGLCRIPPAAGVRSRSAPSPLPHHLPLQGVSFAVFGLGNRQYEHFCAMGKKVEKLMTKLGASQVVRRGDGDDDQVLRWRGGRVASSRRSLPCNAACAPGQTSCCLGLNLQEPLRPLVAVSLGLALCIALPP